MNKDHRISLLSCEIEILLRSLSILSYSAKDIRDHRSGSKLIEKKQSMIKELVEGTDTLFEADLFDIKGGKDNDKGI